ncbi:unnamed protein product, partial [Meganyctiphanes norvegica]
GPPHVRPMGQMTAVAGETFVITCPVAGYPVDKIVWKKDGELLPTSHRQQLFDNGTLIIEQVSRGSDEGQYSCSAQTNKGQHDTQQLSISVMVPPQIAPFNFANGTRAGMRASVTCLVREG